LKASPGIARALAANAPIMLMDEPAPILPSGAVEPCRAFNGSARGSHDSLCRQLSGHERIARPISPKIVAKVIRRSALQWPVVPPRARQARSKSFGMKRLHVSAAVRSTPTARRPRREVTNVAVFISPPIFASKRRRPLLPFGGINEKPVLVLTMNTQAWRAGLLLIRAGVLTKPCWYATRMLLHASIGVSGATVVSP
jgi:hypothetical protein